ncbi:hypothetical protein PT974_10486 [Cladobotryum mycophilum]|uniref:Uncharacterized protein n=1 Tax=Cladobotryum mycophilum TaxID=491253 RepID=A0ABR0SA19_9HYPO
MYKRERLLSQYLEWTVIEDAALEGASKNQIRERFSQWAGERSVKRDGPGVDAPNVEQHITRFNYCIIVDQRCLSMPSTYEDKIAAGAPKFQRILPYVTLDTNCDPDGEEDDGFPPVESRTRHYSGWIYSHIGSIVTYYEELVSNDLTKGLL